MSSHEVLPSTSELLLTTIRDKAPVVDRVLKRFSSQPISHYLQHCFQYSEHTYQSREDLGQVVEEYVTPLLGSSLAEQAAIDLVNHPVALTTNHHGVDFFAQSVQGSVLLGLAKRNYSCARTVPVMACGNIPLDNITYPRGALIYSGSAESEWPLKLPVFSNKYRRQPVSLVKGVDSAMVNQTLKRLDAMASLLPDSVVETLQDILSNDYLSTWVQGQSEYSEQAVILNNRIWRKMFLESVEIPELLPLELEKIATGLLLRDLQNESALIFLLAFNSANSKQLWQELDGVTGCWNTALLNQRWKQFQAQSGLVTRGTGSFLFWGVDERNRRIPLQPDWESNDPELIGCDDNGKVFRVGLTPEDIIEALKSGRLMPTLFTCFSVIALARGVTCLGGYYQGEYLPEIQKGVVRVLSSAGTSQNSIDWIGEVPTREYLCGMQTMMLDQGDALLPAGVAEMIATGAIGESELAVISAMTVGDAHRASLAETVPDLLGDDPAQISSLDNLARELYKELPGSVIRRQL